ncbi:Ig-like domain-containing protein [uncultured Pseudoflavonifractor sp.]|uniref:Ig-like domain-containing protein n=1 Tax=uncultured Pseudoflavonifractor sp. TaxID=1221379 RepID=UPI0025FA7341|nr:Ig-like domain-containing protein [uncultured Pseudoflavonifractor sp.]
MKQKKFISMLAAGALCLSLLPTSAFAAESMDNFKTERDYPAGQFTDVVAGSWYAGSVETAYELGLVEGTSKTTFSPNDPITISSTLALACRLYSTYYGDNATFTGGTIWYQPYVDYAIAKGIITSGQFTDYNANATRRQFAAIMAKALPASALKSINTVEDGGIPDVASGSANYSDIYTLYRAGILTGSDKAGTFLPETTIDRASVSAILSRMAMPSQRQSITLKKVEVAATAISLNRSTLSLKNGETFQLNATLTPANASTKVTWSVSNDVVSVTDDGKVTAKRAGSAIVTATAGNVSAKCSVTVTDVAITRVDFTDSSVDMLEGDSRKLSVSVAPSNASVSSLTWSSDNTRVATVSQDGTVTAVGEGTAKITAKAPSGKYDTCWVYVDKKASVSVPLLNHEYGPMNLTSYYSSGKVMDTNNITSLVFTSVEYTSSGDKYEVKASIQGRTTRSNCTVELYFYDANNRVLGQETMIERVTANMDYNIQAHTYIDTDILDNAVRMEFYYYGTPADYNGGGSGGSTGGNEGGSTGGDEGGSGTETPDYDYPYDTYYGFEGIPSFDEFTSSSRTQMDYTEGKKAGYMYASATTAEFDSYRAALKECGFSESQVAGMYFYSKGTHGTNDYWEVRCGTTSSPYGEVSVMVSISHIKSTNEW